MTTAGQLSEHIGFESRGTATGPDDGNTEGGFVERFCLHARRQNLRGTEMVMASRLEGRQPVIFTVRASSLSCQITTDWQARDKRSGVVFAIRGVTRTEDRAWYEILAESGVAS